MGMTREEALASLPEDLRPIFEQLVEEYRFHSTVVHGKPFVSYGVLAALVRDGWRPSDESPPDPESAPPPNGSEGS
jgi:hypothetical protein